MTHGKSKAFEEVEMESDEDEDEQEERVLFTSVCIDEIKLKIMSPPEIHKSSSVFIASKEQKEKEKQRKAQMI